MKSQERNEGKIRIAVVGSGSWATAILKILTTNGHDVRWWVRQPETVDYIRKYHHNPKYLSSVELVLPEENVDYTLRNIIRESDWVVLATPSAYLKSSLEGIHPEDFKNKHVVSAIKGLVQSENLTVSEYMHQHYGVALKDISNISGPCHAEEVAAEKLSYLTFSSPNHDTAREVAALFKCRFLNTTTCDDLHGTEYASVLKNVYALAAGISVGVGYGDNFRAVLVSRCMAEMEKFLNQICPGQRNILDPAYLGDTLVTAYSQYSRNRTFGLMIGKGYTINSAILELNMVAEGYYATKSLKAIADARGLRFPVLNAVYHILYEKISPMIEFRVLSSEIA